MPIITNSPERKRNADGRVIRSNEGIWDTMSITGFLDFLELYESQEEAIAAARVSPENRF